MMHRHALLVRFTSIRLIRWNKKFERTGCPDKSFSSFDHQVKQLYQMLSKTVHVYTRRPSSILAGNIRTRGWISIGQIIYISSLFSMKVHGSRKWYWRLRAISFIEHPVRSITKSNSLIKRFQRGPSVHWNVDFHIHRSSKYVELLSKYSKM